MIKKLIFLFCLFLVFYSSLLAAPTRKVISKKFDWKVAETKHFDIYYYTDAKRLLPQVALSLEKAYETIAPSLKITFSKRWPFFLYLNHNEFEQTNVVSVGEGTGGVTEAFKNRFLVFNDGTQEWLEHVIAHEFVHVCQFSVVYSGFWKSVRLLKSVFYPLWFMEGMAEYYSGQKDWVAKDMVLRDAVTSNQLIPLPLLHHFNHLKPHQVTLAYKTGNAAMEFIAQEYGEEKIAELLDHLSERFEINSLLLEVLGLDLQAFNQKFEEFLDEKYQEQAQGLKEPQFYGLALTHPDSVYPVFNSNPTFFQNGKSCVYLSDQNGFNELYRYDFEYDRAMALNVQKKFSDQIENIHRKGSALSISKDDRYILFAGEKEQKDYLYLYDLQNDRLKRLKIPLESLHSPQFSPDDKMIIFVGMKDGITDLYSCRKSGRTLKQLTDTFEDENDVRFFSDGRRIVFSREKVLAPEGYQRNLWILDLETLTQTQITDLPGHAAQAAVSPSEEKILFISDQDGISNLYQLTLHPPLFPVQQLTHVIGGNFQPSYSPDGEKIVFISFRRGEQHLYLTSPDPLSEPSNVLANRPRPEPPVEGSQSFEQVSKTTGLRGGGPYKFKASTDFFFPVLFYSSTDGLFLSSYWLASEMLGNHKLQTALTYASQIDFLNYQVIYSYSKFRPQVVLGFLGDTQDNVLITTRDFRREDAQFVSLIYPLNRFNAVQLRMLTIQRRFQITDDDLIETRPVGRENVGSVSFVRDITQGRYLQTVAGYRLLASYQESHPGLASELTYHNAFLDYHQFLPLHKESSIALRTFGGGSFGEDRQIFRAGGSDLLRGYGRFDARSSRSYFIATNLEVRFPLVFDLNYHVLFFFPDFLFKNIYGSIFTDNGILWNNQEEFVNYQLKDVRNSIGVGLRFETFVLQSFPLILRTDWAYRTTDGAHTFYLALGPNF